MEGGREEGKLVVQVLKRVCDANYDVGTTTITGANDLNY